MNKDINLFNLSQNFLSPNQNKSHSKNGDESFLALSENIFPNSYMNETKSNGVKINPITDENILRTKFVDQENLIRLRCVYYISLEKIFNETDIKTKNDLLQYVTEFNNSCIKFDNDKAQKKEKEIKNSDIKNKYKNDLISTKEDLNNKIKEFDEERKEIINKSRKEIDEYKAKLNKAEGQIKNLNNKIKDCEKKIAQKEKENYFLKENFKGSNNQIIPDQITRTYALGNQTEDIDIGIENKKEYDQLSSKHEIIQSNLNNYIGMLVDLCKQSLNKYKDIYFKIKGTELVDYSITNLLKQVQNYQVHNIDQYFSWTNIMNYQNILNKILNGIFELVNPTNNSDDPIKLNENSCEFLLNYIIGLRKLFFLQKEILENSIMNENTSEGQKKRLAEFKMIAGEAKKFFEENNGILNSQSNFERFKNELKEENTRTMNVDEYINNIKSVLVQSKNYCEKKDSEIYELLKDLEGQNSINTLHEVEMEMSGSKNKRREFIKCINNGI